MEDPRDECSDALAAARALRTLTIKAAKERLNETLKVHHELAVRENAWRAYDAAVGAAWDAHDALLSTRGAPAFGRNCRYDAT